MKAAATLAPHAATDLSDDVLYLSVRELGAEIRARRLRPTQLAAAYLARLERLGPQLNAVVTVTRERAMREAETAEREIAAGRYRGPLHGVPYGVKDLLATRDYPTTWGAAPYREQRFDYDATVVQRLGEAGAVLVAKLAMVELAGGMGYNQANASFTGPGRTPWNTEYWSGGSSSGPGAAVGAALVPFAIGSETSGSIMFPSAACGVSGLRPTYGRVSRHGAMALSWTMDKLGPMCRTADDCGLVLDAIAGPDPLDHLADSRSFRYDAPARITTKPVIGVLLNATAGVQPEVARNFEASLEVLRQFATLVPGVELPNLPYGAVASTLIDAECASAFEELLSTGRVQELTAPEDRWGGFAGTAIFAQDYIKALRLRGVMTAQLDAVMAKYTCLVSPTIGTVSYPIGKPFAQAWPRVELPAGTRTMPLGSAANVVGLPGVGVPNGFGREGLPTSVLFTGRAFGESAILAVAAELQRRTSWHRKRPPLA